MALTNLSIQSAVQQNGGRCRPNLSHEVLASAKIGQILPIYHQEMIPGDVVDVNSQMFCRTLPLSVPSYVTLKYRTMSVFVPYHQVADGCESYFANQQYFKGKGNRIPVLTQYHLREFFTTSAVSTLKESNVSAADLKNKVFDLALANNSSASSSWNTYTFTSFGRYVNKVFHLLGYRFGNRLPYASSGTGQQGRFYNGLPLLAFAHAYNSFLSYAPKYNTSGLSATLESIKRAENAVISISHLTTIFSNILLTYEESFITTLWQNPESSTPGQTSGFRQTDNLEKMIGLGDLTMGRTSYGYQDGTQVTLPDGQANVLTAQQVRLLLKYDQFFRRSNFAGSRDIEKIYSQFGVKIEDYKTRYPIFLSESTDIVNIGDVTSQSDTVSQEAGQTSRGASLGSYAGKAIGDGNSGFHFQSNDYGMLFTFAWFAPKPLYYQGCDKENLRIDPFDFYTPQLDQSLMCPVLAAQISENIENPFYAFGYAPLYSEYLYHNDIICGDFEYFKGFEAWHFGRNLDPYQWQQYVAQTDFLIYMGNTGTEFERIFNIENTDELDVDSLYMTIHNSVKSSRPMRDMTGKTGLMPGNVHVADNGNNVN